MQQVALKRPCRDQNQNQAILPGQFLQKRRGSAGCHESVNLTAARRLVDPIMHTDAIIWRKAPKCIFWLMRIRGSALRSDPVAEWVSCASGSHTFV